MTNTARSATVWLWHLSISLNEEHDAYLRHFLWRLHELQQQCCMWQYEDVYVYSVQRWRDTWALEMANMVSGWDIDADDHGGRTDRKLNSTLSKLVNYFWFWLYSSWALPIPRSSPASCRSSSASTWTQLSRQPLTIAASIWSIANTLATLPIFRWNKNRHMIHHGTETSETREFTILNHNNLVPALDNQGFNMIYRQYPCNTPYL